IATTAGAGPSGASGLEARAARGGDAVPVTNARPPAGLFRLPSFRPPAIGSAREATTAEESERAARLPLFRRNLGRGGCAAVSFGGFTIQCVWHCPAKEPSERGGPSLASSRGRRT